MQRLKQLSVSVAGFLLLSVLAILPSVGLAQTAEQSSSEASKTKPAKGMTVLANVNVWNVKIAKQDGNKLTVEFDINNGKGYGAQPGIKYAVRLFKEYAQSVEELVDEKVYAEEISLPEGATVHKSVKYVAPEYLKGKFKVAIVSRNANGLPLGQGLAGEVELNGSGEFVQIRPNTCLLSVDEDTKPKSYRPGEGVAVKKEETLRVSCDIQSDFSQEKTIIPHLETRYRTSFGKKVKEEDQTPFKVGPGEQRTVNFAIAKPDTPQAYEVIFYFTDDKGNVVSNEVNLHYVLAGVSATIHNVRLNKDGYKKGETAVLTVSGTGPADDFPESRLAGSKLPVAVMKVAIVDGDKNPCADSVVKDVKLDQNINQQIMVPIKKDCLNPGGTVKLTTREGKVLAQQDFQIKTKGAQTVKRRNKSNKTGSGMMLAVVLLVIIVLAILIYIYKKKKAGLSLFLLFVLPALFFFAFPKGSEAVTLRSHNLVFSVNLDKQVYQPGENATMNVAYGGNERCYNSLREVYVFGKIKPDDNWSEILVAHLNPDEGSWAYAEVTSYSYTPLTNRVPDTPGSYNAQVGVVVVDEGGHLESLDESIAQAANIPYLVVSCNIDWSSSSVKAPGAVNISWSTNAPRASYSCTGPLTISKHRLEATSGSTRVHFSAEQTGEQVCTLYAEDNNGETIAECSTDRLTIGGTSCDIKWDHRRINAPGTATISWSTDAPQASYRCTGPISGNNNSIPTSGSVPFSFSAGQTGTEVCTLYAKDENGETIEECSDRLIVGSSATCGNGILERGEECDDGNMNDGDGCSSTCRRETTGGGGACRGTLPANAVPLGDDEAVGPGFWRYSSADSWRKCEFQCRQGYHWDMWRRVCTQGAHPHRCTGSRPEHSVPWQGDSRPPYDMPWVYSGGNTYHSCEFHCEEGYEWNGYDCVQVGYRCLSYGRLDPNAIPWGEDESTGLSQDEYWTYSDRDARNRKCEYHCPEGYEARTHLESFMDWRLDRRFDIWVAECIPPAQQSPQCGSAAGQTYAPHALRSDSGGLCQSPAQVADFRDNSELGGGYSWKCTLGEQSVDCTANSQATCNDDPSSAPYHSLNEACRFGNFNSLVFVNGTYHWRCGTAGQSNRHRGSFTDNNPNAGPLVDRDYYDLAGGDADCGCTPNFTYSCVENENRANVCTGHCGETVTIGKQAFKKDNSCFVNDAPLIPVSAGEYHSATGQSCTDEMKQCPPCRPNSFHESH